MSANLRVWVWVSPAEAVRAGSVTSGTVSIDLSPDQVAGLSEALRDELANLTNLGQETRPDRGADSYPYGVLDFDGVTRWLAERIAKREADARQERERTERLARERAEEEAEYERDLEQAFGERRTYRDINGDEEEDLPKPRIGLDGVYSRFFARPDVAAWRRSLAEERIRRWEARAAAQRQRTAARVAAEAEIVKQTATPNQQERFAAGVLPDDEKTKLIGDWLFSALRDAPRYVRLRASDVDHAEDCYCGEIAWSIEDNPALTAEAWERLKQIRALIPETIEVSPRLHVGECEACEATVSRLSALATISWHGEDKTREFVLED